MRDSLPHPANPQLKYAICQLCGHPKKGPFVPCKGCRHIPTSVEERAISWLFSENYLSRVELAVARDMITQGRRPQPTTALQERALEEMGAQPTTHNTEDKPDRTALFLLGILLLSPLFGFAIWWRDRERPTPLSKRIGAFSLLVAALELLLWRQLWA